VITPSLGVTKSALWVPPIQKWIQCPCLIGQRTEMSTETTSGNTRQTITR
jgi:hypothetical protein